MLHGPRPPSERQWDIRSGSDLARTIAEIRHLRGMTQAQFADEVGLGRGYLSMIEAGRTSSVLEHMLRALRRSGAKVTVTLPEHDDDAAT